MFKQIEIINGKTITKKYCVEKCPDQARFYYKTNIPFKENECIEQCNRGDFYSIDSEDSYSYECKSSCETISLIDVDSNIYECLNIGSNLVCCNKYCCSSIA